MKTTSACIPCFLKQAHSTLSYLTTDEDERIRVLKEVTKLIPELDPKKSPAYNSSLILFKVNEIMNADDPYKEARKENNKKALSLLPSLRNEIASASDPLEHAVRLSVVGNVIDLGIKHPVDLEETLEKAKGEGFAIFEYDKFKEALSKANRILYILDNAGEIVFDLLLIEELRKLNKKVISAVKGAPILNDAVMEDAIEVGLNSVSKVIDTGSRFVGVEREKSSAIFLKALDTAELVIAKGQGNYETLEGTRPNIFFILKAKCEPVAEHLGVKEGDLVLKKA